MNSIKQSKQNVARATAEKSGARLISNAQTDRARALASTRTPEATETQVHYLENIMEPTIPFLSPGPAKWLYPVNLRTTLRVPSSTYSHGSVKVETGLSNMLEISQDVNTTNAWSSDTEQTSGFPSSIQFFMAADLKNALGDAAESQPFDYPAYSFPGTPGAAYYPGAWGINPGAIFFDLTVTIAATYRVEIGSYNTVTDTAVSVNSNVGALAVGQNTIALNFITITPVNNLYISVFRLNGPVTLGSLAITMRPSAFLTRVSGTFTQTQSFQQVFAQNQSAVELLKHCLTFKISALSVRLQNSTAELNRGGTLNMAQFAPGSGVLMPQNPADLFNFLGSAPSAMALTAQPLKNGGHISFVPQDFEQNVLQRYPGLPGSALVFAWQNTPNVAGGYYQQDLTVEIRMNIEISSLDPSLRYSLRSPLHYDYVEWFLAYEGTLYSSSGCNPTHMERIRSNIKKFISHPLTKTLFSTLVKVAPAALALL